jgi:hypothetical protein
LGHFFPLPLACSLTLSSPTQEVSLYSIKASTDWMRLTHIMENHILYLKSTNLNVNLIQINTFTETSTIMFAQISEHHDPAKWAEN